MGASRGAGDDEAVVGGAVLVGGEGQHARAVVVDRHPAVRPELAAEPQSRADIPGAGRERHAGNRVAVAVGIFVGVLVGTFVGVLVGTAVAVFVAVASGVPVAVGSGVFVAVSVGVSVPVGSGVLVPVASCAAAGLGLRFGRLFSIGHTDLGRGGRYRSKRQVRHRFRAIGEREHREKDKDHGKA